MKNTEIADMPTLHRTELNGIQGARRPGEFFSQMSPETLLDLDALEHISIYPPNALLFLENDKPRGLFVLREGKIKLSISSSDGKKLVLRIAEAGELLNITAGIGGTSYENTAETLRICKVGFIHQDDLLKFLLEHPDAQQSLIRELILHYHRACEKLRAVVLCSSVPERLARFLLEWSSDSQESGLPTTMLMAMTHEQIGEFIWTSRETVTRTLSDFKTRNIVMLNGSTLTIPNRLALEGCARP